MHRHFYTMAYAVAKLQVIGHFLNLPTVVNVKQVPFSEASIRGELHVQHDATVSNLNLNLSND